MEHRRLGKSGLQVSVLSFGSWVTFGDQIDTGVAESCMKEAYDAGCNFFDNAEGYSAGKSETMMGEVLTKMGWPRETFVVSSKVFFGYGHFEREDPNTGGLSRKHVFDACHAALKRLQVDYLDLYFCHRPDPNTPIEETVFAMNDLVRQGKVMYWGTSEWSAQQITEAHAVAQANHLVGPTMEQPQYHIFHRKRVEHEYAPLYDLTGLGTTIWSPLASGLLTGKYNEGIPDGSRLSLPSYEWLRKAFEDEGTKKRIGKVPELAKLADELGISMPRFALAWAASNPHVSTVITGASKPEQVVENFKAVKDIAKITPEVKAKVDEITEGLVG